MVQRTSTLNLNVDPSKGVAGFATFNRAASATTGVANKVTGALKAMGLVASSAALVSFGTNAVNQYRQYNKALAEVSTLIEGTTEEMTFLDNAAKELASSFGGTAQQQVRAFYQAISAGVGDVRDAQEFLTVANKLAVAGVTDVAVAVDGLTTATNAYQDSGLSASDAADVLFTAVKLGKTTVDEMSGALGRVVSVAATLGVGFDEVSAALAALTSVGFDTSQSVTRLQAAFANVIKPTKQASDLAEDLGIQFNSAGLQALGLKGFLDQVTEATGGNIDQMAKLFGSVEAVNAVVALTGTASEKFANSLVEMGDAVGTVEREFNKVSESLDQRFNVAMTTFQNQALEVGEVLFRVLVPAVEVLANNFDLVTAAVVAFTGALLVLRGHPVIAAITLIGTGVLALVDYFSKADEETKLLNETLADLNKTLDIEVSSINKVRTELFNSNEVTTEAIGHKLNEALARYENIKAINEEQNALIKLNPEYQKNQSIIQDIISDIQTQQEFLQAAIEAGASDEFLQTVTNRIEGLGTNLKGVLLAQDQFYSKLREGNATVEDARKVVDLLSKAINNSKDGVVTLGVTYKNTEDKIESATDKLEDYLENLKEDFRLTQLSAREREIATAIRNAETEGIKDSAEAIREAVNAMYDQAEAAAEAKEREERLSQILIEQNKVLADGESARLDMVRANAQLRASDAKLREEFGITFDELEEQFENLPVITDNSYEKVTTQSEEASDRMQKIWDNAMSNIQRAFGDLIHDTLFEKGIDSFKDFGNAILDIWKRTISEMIAAWITARVFNIPFAGLSVGGGGLFGSAAASAAGTVAGNAVNGGGGLGAGLVGAGSLFGSIGPGVAGLGYIGGSGFLGGAAAALSPGGFGLFGVGANAALAGGGIGATIGAALPAIGLVVLGISALVGKTKLLDEGLDIAIEGVEATANTFRTTRKSRLFGLIRGRAKTAITPVDEETQTAIDDTITGITGTITEVFDALGFAAVDFSGFSKEFEVSLKGLDEAAREAKINELFEEITGSFAQFALQGAGFKLSAEDATTAIENLTEAAQLIVLAEQRSNFLREGRIDSLAILRSQIGNLDSEQLASLKEASTKFSGNIAKEIFDAVGNEIKARDERASAASVVAAILEESNLVIQGINDLQEAAAQATKDAFDNIRQSVLDAGEEIENVGLLFSQLIRQWRERILDDTISELIEPLQERIALDTESASSAASAIDDVATSPAIDSNNPISQSGTETQTVSESVDNVETAVNNLQEATVSSNEESSNVIANKIDELIGVIRDTSRITHIRLSELQEVFEDQDRQTVDGATA